MPKRELPPPDVIAAIYLVLLMILTGIIVVTQ